MERDIMKIVKIGKKYAIVEKGEPLPHRFLTEYNAYEWYMMDQALQEGFNHDSIQSE